MASFNSFKSYNTTDSELKAHSSALTNERISALITLFDQSMINANRYNTLQHSKEAVSFLKQIWKSFRPVVRNDLMCRRVLNLETKVPGLYTLDIHLNLIYRTIFMIELDRTKETMLNIYNINRQLEQAEEVMRDVLQHFKFTFRLNQQLKPDVSDANNKMQAIIDDFTDEQLKAIAGKRNKIVWKNNGTDRNRIV